MRKINHIFPMFEMDVYIGQSSVTQHFRQILPFQHFSLSLFSCLAIILSSAFQHLALLSFSLLFRQSSGSYSSIHLDFCHLTFHLFSLLSASLSPLSLPYNLTSLQLAFCMISLQCTQPSIHLAFYTVRLKSKLPPQSGSCLEAVEPHP